MTKNIKSPLLKSTAFVVLLAFLVLGGGVYATTRAHALSLNRSYSVATKSTFAKIATGPSTPSSPTNACSAKSNTPCSALFTKYINPAINFLSAGFGIIVVIMIVIGGIQYSSSGGDPQKVTSAKSRITNAIIALLVYAFLYGLLQFLVPGGVFNG